MGQAIVFASLENLQQQITAWTQTAEGEVDEIMGVRHRQFAVQAVQFHPESIMTEGGHRLLGNFLEPSSLAGI